MPCYRCATLSGTRRTVPVGCGRDGLLRAATYWRSAEFFTRDRDPDPRGRAAYGGADFGEVVTTAQRITAGDCGSWD